MRIAFTGTHGVGKSTLLQRCVEEFPIVLSCIFDGVARKYHARLQSMTPRQKQRFLDYWYVWKHYNTKDFISARAIYDTWAYAQLTVGPQFHARLMGWANKHIWYDYLFYVPIEFIMTSDGVRPEDLNFQHNHDRRLKLILDYHQIPYHTITGTIEERLEQIREIIDGN